LASFLENIYYADFVATGQSWMKKLEPIAEFVANNLVADTPTLLTESNGSTGRFKPRGRRGGTCYGKGTTEGARTLDDGRRVHCFHRGTANAADRQEVAQQRVSNLSVPLSYISLFVCCHRRLAHGLSRGCDELPDINGQRSPLPGPTAVKPFSPEELRMTLVTAAGMTQSTWALETRNRRFLAKAHIAIFERSFCDPMS
jgi:hypothetical protein